MKINIGLVIFSGTIIFLHEGIILGMLIDFLRYFDFENDTYFMPIVIFLYSVFLIIAGILIVVYVTTKALQ